MMEIGRLDRFFGQHARESTSNLLKTSILIPRTNREKETLPLGFRLLTLPKRAFYLSSSSTTHFVPPCRPTHTVSIVLEKGRRFMHVAVHRERNKRVAEPRGKSSENRTVSDAMGPCSKPGSDCFEGYGERRQHLKKVSKRGGSDALFKECLDAIRRNRHTIAPDVDNHSSDAIENLSQQELDIIREVLQRVDPDKQISPCDDSKHSIDPFWDPFQRNRAIRLQISEELRRFSRLVTAAEARQQRLLIRRSLRRQAELHNPFSKENMIHNGREEVKKYPIPKEQHERFWNPGPADRSVLRNNGRPFSWRDLHLLHNFVGENGLVLPRRLTHASRYQQRCIFKAICVARRMALFPYDWKPPERERMPIMDPLQYLVDELTQRYVENGDKRSRAMLMVMAQRYKDLSFRRFFVFEGSQGRQRRGESVDVRLEKRTFSKFLSKYRDAGTHDCFANGKTSETAAIAAC